MSFKKLLLAIILAHILLPPTQVLASSNFTTDSTATYTVNESGRTYADFSMTLTNKSEKAYPESYKMKLGFDDITNLKATDQLGELKTNLIKTQSGYDATFILNKKPLGVGTKSVFKISFDTKSVARNNGGVWEINIPGVSDVDEFQTFNVEVNVPNSFGKPVFVKPGSRELRFTKDQLKAAGISIAYGEKQSYNFTHTYHLKNVNLYPAASVIALPPDTNYQRVNINSINPKPGKVVMDKDGNWLAEYMLSPTEQKNIKVEGVAEVRLNPEKVSLTPSEKLTFTKATKYWQSDAQQIKKIAKDLETPEEIYEYVINTLKYDFSRVTQNKPRLGGIGALKNPDSAVCREFTDLFISLARANGIPSREVNGFAYTQNFKDRPLSLISDVLHAWPEYYDNEKKTWVMVDPTWGKTTGGIDYFDTLDFDHFTFAVKGVDDSYPIPAGGYKSSGEKEKDKKDVEVTLSNRAIDETPDVQINADTSSSYIAGLPIKIKVTVINMGPGATRGQIFRVSSKDLRPSEQASTLPPIPPFGKETIEVAFENSGLLTNKEGSFTMTYEDKSKAQKVKIVPFFQNRLGGIAIGIFSLILLIIAGSSRRLRLHR